MKILFVALKYDYGDIQRGLSFEYYNFYNSLMKMNHGEHKIVFFPFDEIMQSIGREKMNQLLIDTALQERPDICFFVLYTNEIESETIRLITQKSGAITLNWFTDDHWRFDIFSRFLAPLFHWVITTDYRAIKKYRKCGYQNVLYSQWACNNFLYSPCMRASKNITYEYEVSFVGQPHGNRLKVISKLGNEKIPVKCFGYGWPIGRISQENMIRIFSKSKINLNLSNSSGGSILKSPLKIFFQRKGNNILQFHPPSQWLSNVKSIVGKQRNQIKGRNFEIPGCGGFLLTNYAEYLEKYYKEGREIIIFKDTKDLVEKIRYYLTHETERNQIALNGYKRTMKDHTYEKRFTEIFQRIFSWY